MMNSEELHAEVVAEEIQERLEALEAVAHAPVPVVHLNDFMALLSRVEALEQKLKDMQPAMRAAQGLLPLAGPSAKLDAQHSTTPILPRFIPRDARTPNAQ